VLIIKRVNCINTTSGICNSMLYLHRVTYTGDRIDTIDSLDDVHLVARNSRELE